MEPRYAELTRSLIAGIATGRYPVGSNLPGETDLADEFQISRGTVRVALGKLQDLGLISRRKRAGTKVEAMQPLTATYGPTISSVEELIQYSKNSTRIIHSIKNVIVDQALAAHLGVIPGSEWMEISASRSPSEEVSQPMAWWTVYVGKSDGARIRSRLKTDQRLVCDLIRDATGRVLVEVRQVIRAIGVPERLAERLEVAVDAHALEFTRQYFDHTGDLFQVAVSVHPAERSAYSTVLKRQAQG